MPFKQSNIIKIVMIVFIIISLILSMMNLFIYPIIIFYVLVTIYYINKTTGSNDFNLFKSEKSKPDEEDPMPKHMPKDEDPIFAKPNEDTNFMRRFFKKKKPIIKPLLEAEKNILNKIKVSDKKINESKYHCSKCGMVYNKKVSRCKVCKSTKIVS